MSSQFPDEQGDDGSFARQEDAFRDWIEESAKARFPSEAGRYHLYVSFACPWAHRIIAMRVLKGLQSAVGMTAVDPIRDDKGWRFTDAPDCGPDPINGFQYLSEAYRANDPDYRGRVTVPVLWDKKQGRIVSNSDDDLLRMLNSRFSRFAKNDHDFYPSRLANEIDELNELIYETVNNGVYKAGFASTQAAYEEAVYPLFDTLDKLEERLDKRGPYLFGEYMTETDWRLWVTLLRFDPVYHGHFKCNLRQIAQYPNLHDFARRLAAMDGIGDTIKLDHIKRHYYMTHEEINPSRIVPVGPRYSIG